MQSLGLKVWKAADLWTYRVEVVYIATKSHVLHSDSASCYGVRSEVVETDSAVSAVSQTPRVTKRYLDAPYVRSRSSQVVQVQSGDVRLRGVYWDWVPPFFVQEFHRLRMTTGNGTLHGSAAFDALKFQYAMQDDADAPITFQFYVDLEPHETLQVEFPLEKRFLHASYWTEVADLGSEIPQGVLFDSEGARHFTRPAVTRLPSPDFSFIFNGIALGCFIMALYMTQVTRILVVAPDSAGSRSSPISQLARLVKSVIRHVIIRVKH
ncbi:MAG: uncharacterized protein KVP18_003436 [Porospora cf. gigantea A]|uniref:uncharacterized protein n=1 Tax=Porospora cf. gigantea A TaxID=2853593 RepID=UPI00355A66B7|nr:MAG: hypothetical protein KVP18_003436 [Porospora cf. gigantea A]